MYVCVLDMGSLSCRALCLGWNARERHYQLLGLVELPSSGVVAGEVVNTEKAYTTLAEALHALEKQLQAPIHELSLVYSGVTLNCHNSWGITGTTPSNRDPRDSSSRYVTEEDINRALHSATELRISNDFERLHEIPRCYRLDGKLLRRDILGSNGIRLEVEVHIITCLREAIENLIEISGRGNYRPIEIVHSSIAASYISLTADELEQGCLLLDIGHGGTSFQYSFEGRPLITEAIGIGGYHITDDIAQIFDIAFDVAEQLKLQHGICWPAFVAEDARVIIPGGATSLAQEILQMELCEILNARIEELFELIDSRLSRCGIEREYIQSIVMVGGSSLLAGIGELAEEVFSAPARLGLPNEIELIVDKAQSVGWQSPQYTALFGLALYWLEEERSRQPQAASGQLSWGQEDLPKNRVGFWQGLLDWVKRKLA